MRFPPATADVSQFAYRLPYAALDCSQSAVTTGSFVCLDTPPIAPAQPRFPRLLGLYPEPASANPELYFRP